MSFHPYVRAMDRITGGLGRAISWLTLAMVLIGAYNAIVRYLGRFIGWNLSSNLYLELQWYLFSVLFLLGAGYALKEDAHVRVDVVYGHLSRRARAWIDVLGTILFLLPFSAFVLFVSWPSVRNSWTIREMSPDPGGLPRYPLKAVILVCFVLLIGQAVAELIRNVGVLRHGDGSRRASSGSGPDDGEDDGNPGTGATVAALVPDPDPGAPAPRGGTLGGTPPDRDGGATAEPQEPGTVDNGEEPTP